MIARALGQKLQQSPKSILLLGPRQVGKSTLIESLNPDLSINLSDESTFIAFKGNPNELIERLEANKRTTTVFIDEIQLHPPLLGTIQALVDSKRYKGKLKFYLTGSSARRLRRGQANLLPGRVFSYELGALAAAELDYSLKDSRALRYGFLPEPYLSNDDSVSEKLLSTYSGIYLKEEIQAEALTRNLEGFSRFLLAAAESAGQILDFSKIAKAARIDRKNCTRFFEILEDTLVATKVDVFEKTTADIKKRPKFYFFDVGVLNGLLGNFQVSSDRKGYLFEHLVVNQIINSAKAKDLPIKLSYFRTRGGYEVDLILEISKKVFAIEIKSGQVDQSSAADLLKFREYFRGTTDCYIIGLGAVARNLNSVKVRNVSSFLKEVGL